MLLTGNCRYGYRLRTTYGFVKSVANSLVSPWNLRRTNDLCLKFIE